MATIETACACCGKPIRLETDGRTVVRVIEGGGSPLVFSPMIDLLKLKAPNIIDDF